MTVIAAVLVKPAVMASAVVLVKPAVTVSAVIAPIPMRQVGKMLVLPVSVVVLRIVLLMKATLKKTVAEIHLN